MQAQWTTCATCHQPTMFGYSCQRCGAPMAAYGAPMAPMAPMPQRSSGGSSVGIIIGVAVGAVVLLCLGVGVAAFFMVRSSAEESRSTSSYSSSYGGGSSTSTSSGSSSSSKRIGDRVSMSASTWTVVDVKDLGKKVESTSEWADGTKKTSGRFIQVQYKVTNTGKKQEVLLDTPKIIDGKSREFSAMEGEMDYIPTGTKTAILETLQPSMEKTFYTIIEVPADASNLQVQLTDLGFDGDTETVDTNL